jgi:hypothetical protein
MPDAMAQVVVWDDLWFSWRTIYIIVSMIWCTPKPHTPKPRSPEAPKPRSPEAPKPLSP